MKICNYWKIQFTNLKKFEEIWRNFILRNNLDEYFKK